MKLILIPPAGAALPKPYYLGKYEVTQREWEQVMGYNPSQFGPKHEKVAGMDTSMFPVERVSWFDSVEYCNKLSEREGLKPYYELTVTKRGGEDGKQIDAADVKILGGSGYHIPTGAEWEHALPGGDEDEVLLRRQGRGFAGVRVVQGQQRRSPACGGREEAECVWFVRYARKRTGVE